jgi:hypothetical protein
VSRNPGPPAVLIVDEDLGFVGWLGEIFSQAGYRALPALSCHQAVSLIKRLNIDIDVIAVSERLRGLSAMIGTLTLPHRPLKIVLIRDRPMRAPEPIFAHASLERPSGWEPISRSDWIQKILHVLKQVEAKAV